MDFVFSSLMKLTTVEEGVSGKDPEFSSSWLIKLEQVSLSASY
jgi:hypothetical protein